MLDAERAKTAAELLIAHREAGTRLAERVLDDGATGTCVVPIQVVPGDEVRAGYGAFGNLSVAFA
jgi:hypothetical protein